MTNSSFNFVQFGSANTHKQKGREDGKTALIGTSNSLFLWFYVIGYVCLSTNSVCSTAFLCVCVFNFLSFHFAGPLSPHLTFYLSLSLYLHFCHFLSSLSQSHTPCVTHNVFFFILWFRPSCLTVFALYGLALFKYYFLSLNGTNIVCNYFR